MSIETVRWVLASLLFLVEILLGLSACSDRTPVVIQPGVFSEDWPTALRGKLIKNKRCIIDSVNSKSAASRHFSQKKGELLQLSGWVFSEHDGTPPEVYIQLVGPALTYTAITQTRIARPDVNQTFKLDPAWNAGFDLKAAQNAEPSEYELHVLQVGKQGVAQCASNVFIKIE